MACRLVLFGSNHFVLHRWMWTLGSWLKWLVTINGKVIGSKRSAICEPIQFFINWGITSKEKP